MTVAELKPLTVGELIEKLNKLPKDWPVFDHENNPINALDYDSNEYGYGVFLGSQD